MAAGFAEVAKLDPVQGSMSAFGGGDFQSKIVGAWGVAPADGLRLDDLISLVGMSIYCGFLQSISAMDRASPRPVWTGQKLGASENCYANRPIKS
jgi:hypothetical protein